MPYREEWIFERAKRESVEAAATRQESPERRAQSVIDFCAVCTFCKDFVDDKPCLFLPELFRLAEQRSSGREPSSGELRHLVDLCTMCGLCSCPQVRANILCAKDAFVARDGATAAGRVLGNVQRIGRLGAAHPRVANALFENGHAARVLKAMAGIHPERRFPPFPRESFAAWARDRGLHRKRGGTGRKVAYFHGCLVHFLPEEAKAAVEVLERNGVEVYVPEQTCCGMPSLMAGDRATTISFARFNLERLDDAIRDGYDVVCSCPTCGYVLKNLFGEGAYLSEEYRGWLGGKTEEELREMVKARPTFAKDPFFRTTDRSPRREAPPPIVYILAGAVHDQSYFASLGGWQRIRVSHHTYDLGEYLRDLDRSGELDRDLGPVQRRAAYYPPCHLKEQKIGQPWTELLAHVPGLSVKNVGGAFDCCGMAGVEGFKREFHESSIAIGNRLMRRIEADGPDEVLSDCVSCRMQFNQLLPYQTRHPVEVLRESYQARERA